MDWSFAEYVPALKALSDETRLKIVHMLSGDEMCACKILEEFSISQSTLSYHMKILADSGLIHARRDGAWMKYTLNQDRTKELVGFMNRIMPKTKVKVAFVCVHNSCRSQMAEALANHLAGDIIEGYSAGTETKPQINQDAVRNMKELYQIDMEEKQYSKLIDDIPEVDIVITMGCNVNCPWLPCKHREDWGLDDPTGQSDQVFKDTAKRIEEKVMDLKKRIANGLLQSKE